MVNKKYNLFNKNIIYSTKISTQLPCLRTRLRPACHQGCRVADRNLEVPAVRGRLQAGSDVDRPGQHPVHRGRLGSHLRLPSRDLHQCSELTVHWCSGVLVYRPSASHPTPISYVFIVVPQAIALSPDVVNGVVQGICVTDKLFFSTAQFFA